MAEMDMNEKPSFIGTVSSGIGGLVRGAIAVGIMGVIAGAALGLIVAVAPPAGHALLTHFPKLASKLPATAEALSGATFSVPGIAGVMAHAAAAAGAGLAALGGVAGMVTGIVKSREAGQVQADDVVSVAKIAFAQGVAVGHGIEHASQQQEAGSAFRDRINKERGAQLLALAGGQQPH